MTQNCRIRVGALVLRLVYDVCGIIGWPFGSLREARTELYGSTRKLSIEVIVWESGHPLTAHAPAIEATIPLEINIGFTPLVLLKMAPLKAPATMLFAASCFPR